MGNLEPLAIAVPDWISANFGLIALVLIVLVGVAIGAQDFLRLSPRRIWAMGSVGFRESIRRRVLWITPLAMIGVVAVTQLSKPFDEQDAIRQATKYCLFASGIVVVIATLILACTSLPKEIENRVIYTIVTKPTTRLEIVLGKTLGFARTSGLILLIMGLFSYIYLHISAAQMSAVIDAKLKSTTTSDVGRETLVHYKQEGLLQARAYAMPGDLSVYASVPDPKDPFRWVYGASEHDVLFPFDLPDRVFEERDGLDTQIDFRISLAVRQRAMGTREADENEAAPAGPVPTKKAVKMPDPPFIRAMVLGEKWTMAVPSKQIEDARNIENLKPGQEGPTGYAVRLRGPIGQPDPVMESGKVVKLEALLVVPKKMIIEKLRDLPATEGRRRIFLSLTGLSPATWYGFGPDAVTAVATQKTYEIDPSGRPANVKMKAPLPLGRLDASGNLMPSTPTFRGRTSTTGGQQVRGDRDPAEAPVGVYQFRGASVSNAADPVPMEFRAKIERSGAESSEAENATVMQFTVHNLKTGKDSEPVTVVPESDRPAFFTVPRAAMEGGDFDVYVRSRTDGHVVGLRSTSLAAVTRVHSFAWNLFKSLLILWLLSVLVVAISIFCSTLVSWPIAVVLTLVILLGRWCVTQVGEPATPNQMATDLLGQNANVVGKELFTRTVGGLNWFLNTVAHVLPETERFRVTEDIERGVNIPLRSVLEALGVLGGYGAVVLVLGFLRLRFKEVAP